MKLLKDETEIASVSGPGVTVKLTNQRVIFESGTPNTGDLRIIPLRSVDSFAVSTSQNILLLILGALGALAGLIMMLQRNESGALFFVIGALLIGSWWLTRRIGAFIYSLSGENVIFINAKSNRQAIIDFLNEVQQALPKS